MLTFREGWTKKHVGCDGSVRLVENFEENVSWEFSFECSKCGKYPDFVNIEFRLEGKVVDMRSSVIRADLESIEKNKIDLGSDEEYIC